MKYELTENKKTFYGKTLYQIRALVYIAAIGVKVGDLGGYIESESCLSHDGDAWVSGDAKVYGNAKVYGDALVYGDAKVYGNALVYGNAQVSGNAHKTPVLISGLHWHVTIIDTEINIGCQFHKIEKWEEFTDEKINEMDDKALEFWSQNKQVIMTLANNHKVK